jgi:hypothetical protein
MSADANEMVKNSPKSSTEAEKEAAWKEMVARKSAEHKEKTSKKLDTLAARVDALNARFSKFSQRLGDADEKKEATKEPQYNREAVNKEISKDKRIKGKEAKAIHSLLKGRRGDADDGTRQQAIKYLTDRYEEQCEKYPRTREIPLDLYVRRNLRSAMENMKRKEQSEEK